MNVKIALAQTKPVTGDLEGNSKQIVDAINKASQEEADIVVLPEASITGYCCGALFDQGHFIEAQQTYLRDISKLVPEGLTAIVGYIDYGQNFKNGFPRLYNSVAVLQGGKEFHPNEDRYDKILLANSHYHEDRKYFVAGNDVKVFKIKVRGKKLTIGVPICEDIWSKDNDRDIVSEMVGMGTEMIISINHSYFHYGKQSVRQAQVLEHVNKHKIPFIYVNAVGVGDIVKNIMMFDGGSMAFSGKGEPIAQLKRFEEDFQVIDTEDYKEAVEIDIREKNRAIFDALVFEQKELFSVLGFQKAQVHMSGGLDSSIVGAIVVEAMGKDNTVFISNPTRITSKATKDNVHYICEKLGVEAYWNETQSVYNALCQSHHNAFKLNPTPLAKSSAHAVSRTVQGLMASHQFRTGIVATGNHTEIVEGWASFHDIGSIGVHAPLGDLTKVELFELAEYINERYGDEIIPKALFDGRMKPAAELPDAKEDPINYWVRSGIDAELIRNRKSPEQIIEGFKNKTLYSDFFPANWDGESIYDSVTEEDFSKQVWEAFNNSKRSVYKAAQGAPIVITFSRSRGFSNRETIINKYAGQYSDGWYSSNENSIS